jgi:hypothetical protein
MITSPDGGPTAPPCKDVNLPVQLDVEYETHIPPVLCQLVGMTKAAEWVNEHPLWKMQRISCPPIKKKTQDI